MRPVERPRSEPRLVLEADESVSRASLVGEFNEWSVDANPMVRNGDIFEVTLQLEPGRRYGYRYLLDGDRWQNDWAADEYTPNEFGGDDSVRIT